MSEEISVFTGDKGLEFQSVLKDGQVAVDISAATGTYLLFRKPTGQGVTCTADFVNAGTDGAISFVVNTTTFFDVSGRWQVQPYIVSSGDAFHGSPTSFIVETSLA